MPFYFNGEEISGPRGPAGPDESPIGTIISYMGLTAPKDYLVCDGAEHNIADYPDLADFFHRQFGSVNHFGGDGETTFAVPDMRNLFLRGFHGEAEEQLSGDIGQRQEATENINLAVLGTGTPGYPIGLFKEDESVDTFPENVDAKMRPSSVGATVRTTDKFDSSAYGSNSYEAYTSRPVNMAVLYCIKAVESIPAENVYSLEERRIGTWIDGKPLYRRVVEVTSPSAVGQYVIVEKIEDIGITASVKRLYGTMHSAITDDHLPIPFTNIVGTYDYDIALYSTRKPDGLEIKMGVNTSSVVSQKCIVVLEYTRTTN